MQGRDDRDIEKLGVTTTMREEPSNGSRTSDVRLAPRFVGTRRIGRYQLEAELGAGAYGVVYRALDLDRGLPVAVKLLHYFGAQRLVRFKSEFRVTAELSHPNLLQLYELVADGDHFIIAMELVEGVEFLPYVRPLGVCDEVRLKRTVGQICDGLDALHVAGVLHRDLKPSNVLVRHDGGVRIVDFGLATLAERTKLGRDMEQMIVGSPAYMAPEQALSRPMKGSADLYALGVMMFEAMSGTLPFDGPTLTVLTQKNIRAAPLLEELVPHADRSLVSVVHDLLGLDPDKRPTTREIRTRLECQSTELQISARPRDAIHSLVGRDEELDALERAFVRSTQLRPVLHRLKGPSGVGKSALLRALERRLREKHGALVLEGRCHALETIPHKGLDAVVDGLREHLRRQPEDVRTWLVPASIADAVRMFPVLSDLLDYDVSTKPENASKDDQRRRAHDALAELFFDVAESQPIAIILDDAQWGDLDGARLLERLLTDPRAQRVFVLLAYRDDEAADSPLLEHMARIASSERRFEEHTLALEKIPEGDAILLALSMLANADADVARRIAIEARGEPFFVEQLVLELGEARPATGGLDDMVRGRCHRFGAEAVRMLELACVAGHPLPERLLAFAADVADPRPLLAQLTAASLLRRTGSGPDARIYPYHDRLRVALDVEIDDTRRCVMHRTLAERGESEGSLPSSLLATHFERAGEHARASRHAFAAAKAAELALAFDLAAGAYARSIELDAVTHVALQEAREGRARCLFLAGRCAEAGDAFLAAAATAPDDRRSTLEQQGGEALIVCGRVHDGLKVMLPLLARESLPYPTDMPGIVRALLFVIARARTRTLMRPKTARTPSPALTLRSELAFGVGKGLLNVAPAQGTILVLESLVLALRAGDDRMIARGLGFAGCGFAPFTHAIGPRYLTWASDIAERLDDDHLRTLLLVAKSVRGLLAGAWTTAVAAATEALVLAAETPAPTAWEETLARTGIVSALEYLGELREMESRSREFLRDTRERGDAMTLVMIISALGYPTAAKHDAEELDLVIEEMARTIAGWSVESGLWDLYLLRLRVLRTLCWGDVAAARALVMDAWPGMESQRLLSMPIARGPAHVVRAAVVLESLAMGADAPRVLLRDAARSASVLAREDRPDGAVHAAIIRAAIAHHSGDAKTRDSRLAFAETRARDADMRVAWRMVARTRAVLRGEASLVEALDAELYALGVNEPSAFARFLTPGLAPLRKQLSAGTTERQHA